MLGARSLGRMLATGAGDGLAVTATAPAAAGSLSAIVPVLDERDRLAGCLDGLIAQPPALSQILVVDGGSADGTQALVREYARRDPRISLVDASPVPAGWNGKAWNLAAGLAASDPAASWILTIDADVRPAPELTASLLAHAAGAYLDAFSAAPRLVLSGASEAALHPAFLATLVYRYGLPGNVAQRARDVQANGQCFVAKRDLLVRTGAFSYARASRCEDVTVARHLVRSGAAVGFFEAGSLATVQMYASAGDCWRNWPRSLALRDGDTPPQELLLALVELALVQALPLVAVLAIIALGGSKDSLFFRVNAALALARLGVLAGTRRAYEAPVAAYWLAALCDVPAVAGLARATFTRRHVWRGRALVAEAPRT